MNAFNHLHPAGRWRLLPKTTDGHQFGLVLLQLKPKNFSSCYNQITNRNMKSHKATLDSGPFPLPSCVVWTRRLYSCIFFTAKGEVQAGGKQQQFQVQWANPPLPHLKARTYTVTARRVLRALVAEWALSNWRYSWRPLWNASCNHFNPSP